jgi:Prolyl oligopeptidase family
LEHYWHPSITHIMRQITPYSPVATTSSLCTQLLFVMGMNMAFDVHEIADYVVTDPPLHDPEFPAEHLVTHFISEGTPVHALLWIAQGSKKKGCVVLSPQAFGGDRLESLIIPLLNHGISVLTFQPRGMWDGQHKYSLISQIDDLKAAVEFVRTADANGKVTKNGIGYRIDPDRIAVLGLSGAGGSVSLAACSELDCVRQAIAIAPANHELYRDMSIADIPEETFAWLKEETAGRVNVYDRLKAMTVEEIDRLSVINNIPKLLDKKLLLVGADDDDMTPLVDCHLPIAAAFRKAGAQHLTEVVFETDHLFLTKRIALARLVVRWLRTECGF